MSYDINENIEKQAYVPVEDWPTIQEMADGFTEHRIPGTSALAGRTICLDFENGDIVRYEFVDEKILSREVLRGAIAAGAGACKTCEAYEAYEVRPGIFFVSIYNPDREEMVSLIWKSEDGNVFVAASSYVEVDGERRTKTDFTSAVIEGLPGGKPIAQTSDLAGKRVLYRYSSDDWYEHVYFNKETMAWHCVNGAEKGLADVEKCAYFGLDEDLYILFWTETVLPIESIIIVDLKELRSTGRFFCWDPKPQKTIAITFGSLATVLNQTTYPQI